jgi:FAD:protein FMN transferase
MTCLKRSKNKILIFLGLVLLASGCGNPPLHRDKQVLMGTFIEVISPDERAAGIVFPEIKRIEKLLSKYDPESEVSRLNSGKEFKLSPETFFVLKKCREFWALSNGNFDVTVGPLMDIWGFTDKKPRIPDSAEIKSALARVGMDKIVFNDADNMIKFSIPGMRIDLGGIGKGFALDCAVKKLKESDVKVCLINAGGQIFSVGEKNGKPWRIGIQSPRSRASEPAKPLLLSGGSISTSGDYEQFFTQKEHRYAHIIDPKTGMPAESRIIAVTIKASGRPDCRCAFYRGLRFRGRKRPRAGKQGARGDDREDI